MMLHDLGAEIIKIEDPQQGDYARWMPPLIDGMGAFFRSSNRGKKSVILDLKAEAGQAVLHHLVKQADVLVEGFRPGVTTRLAADYDTLQAINPQTGLLFAFGLGAERTASERQRARFELYRPQRRLGRGAESANAVVPSGGCGGIVCRGDGHSGGAAQSHADRHR